MKSFIISIFVFFLFYHPANSNGLPSPVDYFGPADQRGFSISLSGRYLAGARDLPLDQIKYANTQADNDDRILLNVVDQGAGDQIFIYDLQEKTLTNTINVQGRTVYWLHWANDERLLASISTTFDMNIGRDFTFQFLAARTVSMTPFSDTEPVVLFANDRAVHRQNLFLSSIVDPLSDESDYVLMSAFRRGDLDLWRVNIITGDAKRIATGTPRTFGWVADNQGLAAFRLDHNANGTVMSVFARKKNGGWNKVISTRLREQETSTAFWPLARSSRAEEMYVLTTPPGEERASIALYNLKTGEISGPIFEHEEYDLSGGLIDPHTGEFFGAWYIDDRYQTAFLDENLQKHMNGINAFFDDDANVRLVAASKDFKRLALVVTSPTIAGEAYAYDRINNELLPLFHTRKKLQNELLAEVEMLTVTARDGMQFRAYLTHPSGIGTDQKAPLVVMPHGGPSARDSYDFDPIAQFLASRGYRVLQPNFRGSSGYGNAFREAGYREWGGKMQTDVLDAFYQVRSRGIVKEGKACILGASYGGYVALYAAMTTPDYFACAISIAGVTDLIDIVRYARENGKEAYEFAVRQIGDPRADKDILIARSPARNAEKIALPLLLIHGRQDAIVPYDQYRKFTTALKELDVEYERHIVNDRHQFVRLASTVRSMRHVESFLAEHLGGQKGY